MAGKDLVVDGPVTMGPAGLPRTVGSRSRNAGGQVVAAELIGGQFELAGPHRPTEGGEVMGGPPIHHSNGPRHALVEKLHRDLGHTRRPP